MMFRGLNSALVVFALLFWQIISHATSKEFKDPSEIFHKYHSGVVTVITDKSRGTGFSIDPNEYQYSKAGETVRLIITAFHVVKGTQSVILHVYKNEKNSEGEWKYNDCPAILHHIDVARDIAVLVMPCNTNTCPCAHLGALQIRVSPVNAGESVIIIGDSARRRLHSFDDGKLSDTNYTFSFVSPSNKELKTATTRVHGIIGNFNRGDSGCAVMDAAGKVIGMLSATRGDLKLCLTMDEILKTKEQISKAWDPPRFVGCTAHESALLGRVYWGERSGKSIKEMNALAVAMNAPYFAVAHEGAEAHAFTFHALWWQVLLGNDHKVEDSSQCLCEANSFIEQGVLDHKEGKVMCGCADNSCRSKQFYHRRIGEDNDRRWAIYKTMNGKIGNSGYFKPSDESLAVMENIAGEVEYWKNKTDILEEEMERFKSEYDLYYRVRIAVILCVGTIVVIWLRNRWRNTVRMLEKASTEREELKDQLRSIQQVASGNEEG